MNKNKIAFFLTMIFISLNGSAAGTAFQYTFSTGSAAMGNERSVIGFFQYHTVGSKETLLDVARNYELGYNEIALQYPDIDPWVPKAGTRLTIPSRWILPPTRHEEVVINIPEMRLYLFMKNHDMVKTYPLGLGREGFETPVGLYHVVTLQTDPTWMPPPSAWETYGKTPVPPGPNNPLGDYWIGLSVKHIGIHGTNNPWGVGRLVSRGCIRMYPEHISRFFGEVGIGARVEVIYEPVKIGIEDELVYLEVHPDIYGRIPDLLTHTEELLKQKNLRQHVRWDEVIRCIEEKNGVPLPVGSVAKGGDGRP
jgi:L,D-transpeptidase ErfK/SrfK